MTANEVLCRHFSRMGARLKFQGAEARRQEKVRIDVDTDCRGEFFDIRCRDGLIPEVLDIQPSVRHLVLMVRDGSAKNKYLLGHDERHWFAAAIPDSNVRDVKTAMASLKPLEIKGLATIRQGEWFFVPAASFEIGTGFICRNEPLSRGSGSKPHICEELTRRGGAVVMVSSANPVGIALAEYEKLIASNANARKRSWRRMVRDAEVYVRGKVRHPDHKTVNLSGWHRVYMNRERFARHAAQIAFLD
jgi:hypothetical protein